MFANTTLCLYPSVNAPEMSQPFKKCALKHAVQSFMTSQWAHAFDTIVSLNVLIRPGYRYFLG